MRFYFRFIAPNLNLVEQELTDLLWEFIGEQSCAFVGLTACEDLCREWTLAQARAGQLSFGHAQDRPFLPEIVGRHWAADAQVDVVAVNWREQAILLGECKWGVEAVGRSVVRELVDKAPRVVPGGDWQVHYVLFARPGWTCPAGCWRPGSWSARWTWCKRSAWWATGIPTRWRWPTQWQWLLCRTGN